MPVPVMALRLLTELPVPVHPHPARMLRASSRPAAGCCRFAYCSEVDPLQVRPINHHCQSLSGPWQAIVQSRNNLVRLPDGCKRKIIVASHSSPSPVHSLEATPRCTRPRARARPGTPPAHERTGHCQWQGASELVSERRANEHRTNERTAKMATPK